MKLEWHAWQLPTMLYLTLLAPALAALVLMLISYAPGWFERGEPIDPAGFLITFVGIAIPASYLFGLIPAFLGAIAYCVILTTWPAAKINVALRSFVGLACGGIVGGFWCSAVVGLPKAYAAPAALTAALLALRWPAQAKD